MKTPNGEAGAHPEVLVATAKMRNSKRHLRQAKELPNSKHKKLPFLLSGSIDPVRVHLVTYSSCLYRDRDLQRAIKLSEEEEAKRAEAVEQANSKSLFEDNPAQTVYVVPRICDQPSYVPTYSPAGNTNPFPLVDASALQPQYTLQPQFTIQPQITSFNPYLAQQQQEAQQLAWAQQQQEWQQQEWLRQQAELQAQAQAQAQLQAQNDWAMQQVQLQQMQQMQAQQQALQQQQLQQQQTAWLQAQQTSPLISQPTGFGSKNPFALSSPASAVAPVPQLPTPVPSHSQAPSPSRSAPPTTSAPTVKVSNNPENEALAALFANREGGTDTFGNIGNLRYALDFSSW